ncbi:hypothetical protein K466DRAFT_129729 [Polyporus arcularius HHB13444]|uniref:Uncharacterized protein n=1 Tax=Polyporus arcularius HHB13444 TaxID=1314778 RepID=A0A5C3PX28_9APHY|nr:hypothetical protein K466DRAFT_129729 [Polyporus arcularius HHB13444]
MQTSTAKGNGLADADLAFLYPRKLEPDEPRSLFERSFFMLPPGSDVPPRYPNKNPPRTLWDLIVMYLFEDELSVVALADRAHCHAVRKRRFRILRIHPHMNHARLVHVIRPATTIPYVRQLTVNGRLGHEGMIWKGQPDHRWLNQPRLVQLIEDLCTHSPIEFLCLQSLGWGNIRVEIRTALRSQSMRGVRALMMHDVIFWNSNQYLMTLNAYPGLQFLSVWHANFQALTHVPAQLQRTEPLLLTELIAGCAYTGLLMEWLMGRREVLAIEEMTLDCKDQYRDDARLARVLRKVSPWLKRFYYMEYRDPDICEGAGHGISLDLDTGTPKPWVPPARITREGDSLEDEEDDAEVMDVDHNDSSDIMDEDSEADVIMSSDGVASPANPATTTKKATSTSAATT